MNGLIIKTLSDLSDEKNKHPTPPTEAGSEVNGRAITLVKSYLYKTQIMPLFIG